MGKICDLEGDLELWSIFEAIFRNNLLCFHGEENISAKGCIKIEPKLIFSSQSIFKLQAMMDGWSKKGEFAEFESEMDIASPLPSFSQ